MSSELKVRTHTLAASFSVPDKLMSKRKTALDCVYLEKENFCSSEKSSGEVLVPCTPITKAEKHEMIHVSHEDHCSLRHPSILRTATRNVAFYST